MKKWVVGHVKALMVIHGSKPFFYCGTQRDRICFVYLRVDPVESR